MNGQRWKKWKRSVSIDGHKTCLSLEPDFFDALKKIAAQRGITLSNLLADIDKDRLSYNLSSSVRLYVLRYYLPRAECCQWPDFS
jgi:predicted DNA-binding ribbon-helix-helix protein